MPNTVGKSDEQNVFLGFTSVCWGNLGEYFSKKHSSFEKYSQRAGGTERVLPAKEVRKVKRGDSWDKLREELGSLPVSLEEREKALAEIWALVISLLDGEANKVSPESLLDWLQSKGAELWMTESLPRKEQKRRAELSEDDLRFLYALESIERSLAQEIRDTFLDHLHKVVGAFLETKEEKVELLWLAVLAKRRALLMNQVLGKGWQPGAVFQAVGSADSAFTLGGEFLENAEFLSSLRAALSCAKDT